MSTAVDPKSKVALVTGSSSGIGLATAQGLARRGVNVILHGSRDKSLVASALEEIRSYGVRADYVQCDLTKPSNINSMWEQVLSLYNDGVDILINNAGTGHLCEVENFPDDKYDSVMAVNMTAAYHLTKRSVTGMKKKGWGRIVNVSSAAGHIGMADYSIYCASKHAIIGFTKGVALELAPLGITCNAVCPAYTETPILMGNITHAMSKGLSKEDIEKFLFSQQPVGKVIKPGQVAELIEFLCLSGASSQMTGASYLIDGGMIAH